MCSPFLVIEGPLGLSNYCFSIDPQRIWLEYRMGVLPRQRAIPCKSLQTTSDLTEILGVSQLRFNLLSIPLRTTAVDLLTFWGGDILKPVLKNRLDIYITRFSFGGHSLSIATLFFLLYVNQRSRHLYF
jgi:hypothetical protein